MMIPARELTASAAFTVTVIELIAELAAKKVPELNPTLTGLAIAPLKVAT